MFLDKGFHLGETVAQLGGGLTPEDKNLWWCADDIFMCLKKQTNNKLLW